MFAKLTSAFLDAIMPNRVYKRELASVQAKLDDAFAHLARIGDRIDDHKRMAEGQITFEAYCHKHGLNHEHMMADAAKRVDAMLEPVLRRARNERAIDEAQREQWREQMRAKRQSAITRRSHPELYEPAE